MATLAAGYDKISDVASLTDRVITSGLGNCIAVVGIDNENKEMRIAHYDTFRCFPDYVPTSAMAKGNPQYDFGKGSSTFVFNLAHLKAFRDWFKTQFKCAAPKFQVGMGFIWANTSPDLEVGGKYSGTEFKRDHLMKGIVELFGYEPRHANRCIYVEPNLGQLVMHDRKDDRLLNGGWDEEGTDIPYDDLN